MMLHNLFAYGTLQLPEITERVMGRALQGEPATLTGYRVGLVARANFPGIVPDATASVPGMLICGITQQELVKLDQYEGELYRRVRVQVVLDQMSSGAQPVATKCWAYLIACWAQDRVTAKPWTLDWYRQQGIKGRLTYRN